VKKILEGAKDLAESILLARKADLEKLAEALITQETLIDDEVRSILGLPPRENSGALSPGLAGA
jgi:cell division protease FtsH